MLKHLLAADRKRDTTRGIDILNCIRKIESVDRIALALSNLEFYVVTKNLALLKLLNYGGSFREL